MAVSSLSWLALAAVLAPLAQANAAAAKAAHDAQAPILLDAQSTSIDLKTNSAVFSKIRISQVRANRRKDWKTCQRACRDHRL
jgi:hypothetical protein